MARTRKRASRARALAAGLAAGPPSGGCAVALALGVAVSQPVEEGVPFAVGEDQLRPGRVFGVAHCHDAGKVAGYFDARALPVGPAAFLPDRRGQNRGVHYVNSLAALWMPASALRRQVPGFAPGIGDSLALRTGGAASVGPNAFSAPLLPSCGRCRRTPPAGRSARTPRTSARKPAPAGHRARPGPPRT